MKRFVAAVLTVGLLAVLPANAAGSLTKKTYRAADGRTRAYWLYVPSNRPSTPMPLIVFLHGCIQTAEGAMKSTGFNALAQKKKFVVVYPQQNVTTGSSAPLVDGNGTGCWNWFLPDHQARGAGEPSMIAGITRAVIKAQRIDTKRVYLDGISAGGDMAAIMGATYPDLYAAVGVIAACAYATCADATGALAHRAMGTRARVVPVFQVQASTDTLNVVAMGGSSIAQWLGTNDLADDGEMNASVSRTPSSVEHRATDPTLAPGTGDTCVRNNHHPCPGGALGLKTYPHTVSTYRNAHCVVMESWLIHGLTHSYPNGDGQQEFTDPIGPDITTAAYNFFMKHPRSSC